MCQSKVAADYDSASVKFARDEMNRLWPDKDDMQDLIKQNILDVIAVVAAQGHSGFSHGYLMGYLPQLLRMQPIAPLTGEDDEWMEVSDALYQNIRCGEVFKDKGETYWINGKIFVDPNGCSYTSKDSRVPVEFPWTQPESEIVYVDSEGNPLTKEPDSNAKPH